MQVASAGISATLTWTPIPYTEDGGYYEISYAAAPDGPFQVHGHTADRTVASYTVTDLLPGQTYYFRVRTFTPAHAFGAVDEWGRRRGYTQQSDLWSDYSAVVSNAELTPTPTETATPTATATETATPTATATETLTPTPTATPPLTLTVTPSATPTVTATATPARCWLPLIWR